MSIDMSMLANMMPPGVQQLYDSLQPPGVLAAVAANLREEGEASQEEREGVAKFLDQLAIILEQQGLSSEAENQTEQLRLQCSRCLMTFGVDNAYSYHRRLQEGYVYACANEHPSVIVGSGRNGELTTEEEAAAENPNREVVIIYGDYTEGATEDAGSPVSGDSGEGEAPTVEPGTQAS